MKRRAWGCDEPAPEPVLWIEPCPFCAGRNPACDQCSGTDRVPIMRCPQRLVTQRELSAVSAALLVERGVLPDAGGWEQQAHTFVAAFPLLCSEIAHWRQVASQRAIEQAKQKRGRR